MRRGVGEGGGGEGGGGGERREGGGERDYRGEEIQENRITGVIENVGEKYRMHRNTIVTPVSRFPRTVFLAHTFPFLLCR